MILRWSPEALDDLGAIYDHVAQDDPMAGAKILRSIRAAVEQQLGAYPELGRPGRIPHTREFVVPRSSYVVPYRMQGNVLQILRVLHAARQWPETF